MSDISGLTEHGEGDNSVSPSSAATPQEYIMGGPLVRHDENTARLLTSGVVKAALHNGGVALDGVLPPSPDQQAAREQAGIDDGAWGTPTAKQQPDDLALS